LKSSLKKVENEGEAATNKHNLIAVAISHHIGGNNSNQAVACCKVLYCMAGHQKIKILVIILCQLKANYG